MVRIKFGTARGIISLFQLCTEISLASLAIRYKHIYYILYTGFATITKHRIRIEEAEYHTRRELEREYKQ